jgi:hypothetical protein
MSGSDLCIPRNGTVHPCGTPGNLFRCFELAQLTGGGLGRSTPRDKPHASTLTHCVKILLYTCTSLTELPSIE